MYLGWVRRSAASNSCKRASFVYCSGYKRMFISRMNCLSICEPLFCSFSDCFYLGFDLRVIFYPDILPYRAIFQNHFVFFVDCRIAASCLRCPVPFSALRHVSSFSALKQLFQHDCQHIRNAVRGLLAAARNPIVGYAGHAHHNKAIFKTKLLIARKKVMK